MSRNDLLFNNVDWFSVERGQQQKLQEEIRGFDGNRLLNTSVDDLSKFFAEKYRIDVPQLSEDRITAEQGEVEIDISRDPDRYFSRPGPHFAKGTKITVTIPFEGDGEVFKVQPSSYTLNPPRGHVRNQVLTLEFQGLNLDAKRLRTQIDSEVAKINQYLNNLRACVNPFNATLYQLAQSCIEARRKKLLADQNLVADLGFPLKERSDAPATYAAPQVKRRLKPTLPKAGSEPYRPEPVLPPTDYEHILSVIQSMAEVMERSPSAFVSMDEEALRSHFLVQLNGHYEGQATGETFNYEGKTDILIRVDGKNIFIGECKYWGGAKKLNSTIDQILSYSCWRDTKVAIIIFNQRKNFTNVLDAIVPTMEAHPNYKRTLTRVSETQSAYIYSHRDDPNREMTLTVLAFDVPGSDEKTNA